MLCKSFIFVFCVWRVLCRNQPSFASSIKMYIFNCANAVNDMLTHKAQAISLPCKSWFNNILRSTPKMLANNSIYCAYCVKAIIQSSKSAGICFKLTHRENGYMHVKIFYIVVFASNLFFILQTSQFRSPHRCNSMTPFLSTSINCPRYGFKTIHIQILAFISNTKITHTFLSPFCVCVVYFDCDLEPDALCTPYGGGGALGGSWFRHK